MKVQDLRLSLLLVEDVLKLILGSIFFYHFSLFSNPGKLFITNLKFSAVQQGKQRIIHNLPKNTIDIHDISLLLQQRPSLHNIVFHELNKYSQHSHTVPPLLYTLYSTSAIKFLSRVLSSQ